MMNYWLLKSEPTSYSIYSIDDLFRKKTKSRVGPAFVIIRREFYAGWYEKRGFGFFYHSNCEKPGIVGVVEIVRESYPDLTALDLEDHHYDPKSTPDNPRWLMVD